MTTVNYIPQTVLIERFITPAPAPIDAKPFDPSLTITDAHARIIRLAACGVKIGNAADRLGMAIRPAERAFEKLYKAGHLRRKWAKSLVHGGAHAFVYFAIQTSEVIQ